MAQNTHVCLTHASSNLSFTVHRKYNTAIVNLLLRNGAKLNSIDSYGCTPLHEASMLGFDAIVSTMLNQGGGSLVQQTINIKSKKDSLTPLQIASICGHEAVVKQLIMHGANVNVCNRSGESPLHDVSSRGYANIAKLLLKANPDLINIKCTTNHRTALHLAAERDQHTITQLLIDHSIEYGVDNNIMTIRDLNDYTPKDLAIRCCSFSVARLLSKYESSNEAKKRKRSNSMFDNKNIVTPPNKRRKIG